MSLFEQINDEIKKAMLAREQVRLEALRAIKKVFLEAKTAPGNNNELTDENALKIISKLLKQSEESAAIYHTNNRPELAEQEEAQAEVFRSFLPQPISKEELLETLRTIIARLGVVDIKGMGQVMGAASKELAGKASGKEISDAVKELLT